jgi:menaquinone-dependent protoporphyrinogen oxidase
MCELPVFYATTEGQTRRIAERIAAQLRKQHFDSRAIAIVSDEAAHVDWPRVRGACLAASLHRQTHQREAVTFARRHARELSAVPSLFVSVSLAAVSTNAGEVRAAHQLAERFATETGWTPTRIAEVAGRLAYTQYNWLVKYIMRRIALKAGGSGDTSRDHEYTDWTQVESLANQLASDLRRRDTAADLKA